MAEILRNRDSFGACGGRWSSKVGIVLVMLTTASLGPAGVVPGLSPEAQLESATHREMVLGDLKGAIEQYRAVLEQVRNPQGAKPRAMVARTLFQMGRCFEKSGRRTEAQAIYTRLTSSFADQTEFAAEARARLAEWADTLPAPPQLTFALGGPGNVPPGWFLPVLPKDSGCPAGLSCTVVLVPPGAPIRVTGEFAWSFSAAAYRGKTVKLHARVRVESTDTDSHAQLWMSIDRTKGVGDRVTDRAVPPGDWVAATVSAHVDEDATLLNLGVSSLGRERISVDDVSLEIVPGVH